MLSCTTISYALPSALQVISLVCLLVAILFVTTLNDYNATARCTTAIVLCANIQTKWEGKASKWLNYLCTMMPFCYIVAMANMWAVRKLLCVWWMSCRSFDPSSLLHHIYFSIEIPLAFFVWHSQLLVRVRCWGPCNSLEGSIRARLGRIRTIYSRPALCVLAYKWPKIVWSLVYIFSSVHGSRVVAYCCVSVVMVDCISFYIYSLLGSVKHLRLQSNNVKVFLHIFLSLTLTLHMHKWHNNAFSNLFLNLITRILR